jgi:tetratricopeptide (TPR) repeat protein
VPDPLLPLEQRLKIIVGALERARKFQTGLILFVIYRVESQRADFERRILARLADSGQRPRRIYFRPDDPPEAADLLARLQQAPPTRDETIFVYNLAQALPGLLNALNYRRELIPEHRWRLLFWAREEEVVAIIRGAPDFWAFVNQTIELPELPSLAEQSQFTQATLGYDRDPTQRLSRLSGAERQTRIALRERMLAELPPDESAISARAEIHDALGDLYFFEDHLTQAEQHFQAALTLFTQIDEKLGQANTLQSLGDLAMRQANLTQAQQHFQAALTLFTQIDDKLGQANTLRSQAHLFDAQGRLDQALKNYETALSLYHSFNDGYSMAVTFGALGELWLRHDRPEAAYQAWAQRLLLIVQLEPVLFGQMSSRTVSQAKDHAQANPDQAALGCAALIDALQPMPEKLEQAGHSEAAGLSALTLDIFRLIGLVGLAAGQSDPERAESLAQARHWAAALDQQTNSYYDLAAWVASAGSASAEG